MKHTPVQSSQIASVGYDPATKTLEIKFTRGGHYAYANVSQDAYAALIGAKSIGSHFHSHIRGQFNHKRLDV